MQSVLCNHSLLYPQKDIFLSFPLGFLGKNILKILIHLLWGASQ